MSVVLDAVNTLFGPNQSHLRDTHSRTPSRVNSEISSSSETHMSESAPRAHSSTPSSNSNHAQTQRSTPTQPRDHVFGGSGAPRSSPHSQPHSPTLDAASQPPAMTPSGLPTSGSGSPHAFRTRQPRLTRPQKIKVRDLDHIQSFANEDMGSFSEIRSRSRSRSRGAEDDGPQYEISEMKVEHIIEMVAGLLTKITTTNDRQHEHLHRQPPSVDAASHQDPQTTSVLAFHGKNVPSITILSYLSRIHKYCPTSYEVFLSLLVYFDRMTERVNAGPMQSLREATSQSAIDDRGDASASGSSSSPDGMEGVTVSTPSRTQQVTPPASGSMEKPMEPGVPGTPHSRPNQPDSPSLSPGPSPDPYNLSHFFVVDSFNIHRLVIAGVTCASKFFSDIFYTNSRYAKVGGLPLPELNHLELQFLRLNDFRLSVPVEEIEAYGTMLVEFYAREIVAQNQAAQAMQTRSLSESSSDSTATVRAGSS